MARTILNLSTSGVKIRELRELRGWRQEEVERRTAECETNARVPRTRLSRIERDLERPTALQLSALAAVFEVPVTRLLRRQPRLAAERALARSAQQRALAWSAEPQAIAQ